MYGIAGILTVVYLVWGIVAVRRADTREDVPPGGGGVLKIFYRMASLLVCSLEGKSFSPFENQSVRKRLQKLQPTEDTRKLMREYYVKKMGLILAMLLAGTIVGCAAKYSKTQQAVQLQDNAIVRGSFDQQNLELQLRARLEDRPQTFQIEVHGQIPNREEADLLEKEFWEKISAGVAGGNPSLDAVSSDLYLPEQLEDYPFRIEWESSRPDVVDDYGWVRTLEDGQKETISLTAFVKYEGWVWEHELQLQVVAPPQREEQLLHRELEEILQQTEEQTRDQGKWELPSKWRGQDLNWEVYEEDDSLILWLLILAASFLTFFLADKDLDSRILERERQMKDAYPVIVNKLILYLAAGMNARSAFCKIAEDYMEEREQGKEKHPAYEEMTYTLRELQTGVSEGIAYERFGRRSGIQEYVRFSALLAQNQKKGSYTFLARLREETEHSRQEQLNRFRQKGELASTKLLLPMVMMLAVVMIMIMIPAFGNL